MAAKTRGVAVDVFRKFSGHFPTSAWRPHYVRWERHARVRFDHPWLVRAEGSAEAK